MRVIDHVVAGGQTATDAHSPSHGARHGDVFDPNSGQVQARVALARKLSVILHSVWRSGEPFRWEPRASAA